MRLPEIFMTQGTVSEAHARRINAAAPGGPPHLWPIQNGSPVTIGDGFTAFQFRHSDFPVGTMSPFVLVDHFVMWQPTFNVHPHAGMSAVTLAFEDTKGRMQSRDSVGHEAIIRAGDLHWTLAGRGILHTQLPADPESRIHALQIFVNLPARAKGVAPNSFHVAAGDMPVVECEGARVRVVAGDFLGHKSPARTPEPVLILDCSLVPSEQPLPIPIPSEWNAWILVVDGKLVLGSGQELATGQALCASASDAAELLSLRTDSTAHFVVLAGPRIDEPVVQHGPFVFESEASLEQAISALKAGRFGQVNIDP
jgi:redox-sensitive bicupin YhaK (pirin superfamily)